MRTFQVRLHVRGHSGGLISKFNRMFEVQVSNEEYEEYKQNNVAPTSIDIRNIAGNKALRLCLAEHDLGLFWTISYDKVTEVI